MRRSTRTNEAVDMIILVKETEGESSILLNVRLQHTLSH